MPETPKYLDESLSFAERAKDLVSRMTLEEKASQMVYTSPAIERLGVPAYNWWNEALHGVARAGTATMFPQAIAMAAMFDADLVEKIGSIIATEGRAKYNESVRQGDRDIYKGLTFWSPNINIFRDPRWGRGHETYGEDPYLTARLGVRFVKGLQGDDEKYLKAAACAKHFAVHSGPESLRHEFDAVVSKQDLFDTYLPAFEALVKEAKVESVMGAYNRVYGQPACASDLLTDILRNQWGFAGHFVSDCGALSDFHLHHKVTDTAPESAALAVKHGCDVNCGAVYLHILTAIQEGLLTEDDITPCVERLMATRMKLGMFDKDGPYDQLTDEVVESPEHLALSRKMTQESGVLLKNNGILPLDPKANVAVIGPNADDKSVLLGNYNGTPSQYTTLLRGIQEAAQGKVRYARGCHIHRATVGQWEEHPLREAILAAQKSDVVILCMGLNPTIEGEEGDAYNGDMSGDKTSLDLPASQEALIEEILKVGKPTVFLNVTGSCVNLTREDQACDAVLQVFYPGAEGGKAVADILYGKVSPSGRLPVTFYHNDSELPRFTDYSMKGRTYKYFQGKPLYPFAHGLSYTEFAYENLAFDGANVTGTVKNTGAMASGHAIPVFVKDPEEEGVNCRLAGFSRVELEPGQEAGFQVELCPEILSLFQEPQRLVALVGGVDGCQVNR